MRDRTHTHTLRARGGERAECRTDGNGKNTLSVRREGAKLVNNNTKREGDGDREGREYYYYCRWE
jgi:hypothetical protein